MPQRRWQFWAVWNRCPAAFASQQYGGSAISELHELPRARAWIQFRSSVPEVSSKCALVGYQSESSWWWHAAMPNGPLPRLLSRLALSEGTLGMTTML